MNMPHDQEPGFNIAAFGIDGEQMGTGFWPYSKLSGRWLAICQKHIEKHGMTSAVSLDGQLSHIRVKLTSAAGAALSTLVAHGKTVSSSVLLSGKSPSADSSSAQMFVDSLRRICPVELQNPNSFEGILSIESRPLMAVIHWPESSVCDEDHELVREFALHFGGAYFAMQL